MKKKVLLIVALLTIAAVMPLFVVRVQATLSAGPNQQAHAGQTVRFNGTTTDNASTIIQVTWNFGDGTTPVNGSSPTLLNTTHVYTAPGVFNATLTVRFGVPLNKTDTATTKVTILENQPPVVNAGKNVTAELASPNGTQVTLNGTATDDTSTRFNFTWSENAVVLKSESNVSSTTLTRTFTLGTHVVTLNATDQAGNTGTAKVWVTIVDTTPPELNVFASANALWPPNHKYVTISVNATASDKGDTSPKIGLVSITSNEPDNGLGDGNTVNDFVAINNFTFNLRAERSGMGSGRTYAITYTATDASGNSAMKTITIEVPHNS